MKRLVPLLMALVFLPLLSMGDPVGSDDFFDTQYTIFEREQGQRAFVAAQTIMDSIGAPVDFDADTDKEVVKTQLLKMMIQYFFGIDEYEQQVHYMQIAEPFFRETDNLMDLAGCYNIMGISCQRMGQFNEAIHYYNKCSDLLDEIGSPVALTNKRYEINNVANIYTMMEECDMAEEMYLKCIEMLGEVGTDPRNNLDLAAYYMNLAEVYMIRISKMAEDDPERASLVRTAVDYAEQSLDLSRLYGDRPEKMANRFITVSKTHFEEGRVREAMAELDSAMVIIEDQDLVFLKTGASILQGDFAYRTGRLDDAERYYVQAAEMAEEFELDEFCVESLNGAYLASKKNHPERSVEYLERCNAWRDTIYNQEQQALIRDYQVKYQTAEKEREIAEQQAQNEKSRHRMVLLVVVVVFLVILAALLLHLAFKRRKQNELLKRRHQIKDHLFSVVSHDIKAPVETQAQLLELMCGHVDTLPPAELKEGLEGMKKSAIDLKEKLLNLIYWVKGELGDNESHPTAFNLNALTQSVIDEMSSQAALKSLSVVNEMPLAWEAFDDANIVRMVLQNLLSNAVKFSKTGGTIRMGAKEEGGRYRLFVADQGNGISKEKLAMLLQEMTVPGSGTSGEKGTGIGLFVSRQLMDRIGGEIDIESEENQGTTVSITVNKA
ncbi:MAG: tetratricopeptide repeat-containing sensor histidine kinase [Bacteroidales bacterium]|nr:tetratricopeptide repeat-containing sensor histidine kinase [Bacteroidales bacterium]